MKPEKLMRALEIKADQFYFEKKLLPEGMEDMNLSSRPVTFFLNYGFKVPAYFSEIYSMYNGIESEKYISTGFYNFVIAPYLMNLNLFQAYDDKNIYSMLFPDVHQPKILVKNMNGHFYLPDSLYCVGKEIQIEDVIEMLSGQSLFIVKPSMETGGGNGVGVFDGEKLDRKQITDILIDYHQNFVIQKLLYNHPDLAKLNRSSLNTCRIVTYRRPQSSDYVLLGAFVRFGSNGFVMDNATAGGGFCKINHDGSVEDKIWSCKHLTPRSLKTEKGIEKLEIPKYSEMVSVALKLHKRLPYCDLIGWDLTVTDNNEVALVEYNMRPDVEGFQILHGPFFGDYTEELLESLSEPITEPVIAVKRSFIEQAKHNTHIFDFTEMDKL